MKREMVRLLQQAYDTKRTEARLSTQPAAKSYTDKKDNEIFLTYKEIQMGSVIYEEGLPNAHI
jgi:hypothetical protein